MGTDKHGDEIVGYVNPDGSGEGNWDQPIQPEASIRPIFLRIEEILDRSSAEGWTRRRTSKAIAIEARAASHASPSQERPPMATPSHAAQVIDVLTQVKAALMTDPILSSNLLVTDQIAVVIDRLSRSVEDAYTASPEDE